MYHGVSVASLRSGCVGVSLSVAQPLHISVLSLSMRGSRRREERCEGVVRMRRKRKESNGKNRESAEDREIKRSGVRGRR